MATESVDRIRLSRAPHMKYKYLLGNGGRTMDKALEYFRRVAKQTDSPLARAVAYEREFICEVMRILPTPHAPPSRGLAPPTVRLEGMVQTSAVMRALSRMFKDAARAETPFLRAFGRALRVLVKVQRARDQRPAVDVHRPPALCEKRRPVRAAEEGGHRGEAGESRRGPQPPAWPQHPRTSKDAGRSQDPTFPQPTSPSTRLLG